MAVDTSQINQFSFRVHVFTVFFTVSFYHETFSFDPAAPRVKAYWVQAELKQAVYYYLCWAVVCWSYSYCFLNLSHLPTEQGWTEDRSLSGSLRGMDFLHSHESARIDGEPQKTQQGILESSMKGKEYKLDSMWLWRTGSPYMQGGSQFKLCSKKANWRQGTNGAGTGWTGYQFINSSPSSSVGHAEGFKLSSENEMLEIRWVTLEVGVVSMPS